MRTIKKEQIAMIKELYKARLEARGRLEATLASLEAYNSACAAFDDAAAAYCRIKCAESDFFQIIAEFNKRQ